ncbi:MAG: AIPR family protein, partial [Okeania sp. SIO2H7]|nr:AIPR family protein [Okeania sp. SIO2H7]
GENKDFEKFCTYCAFKKDYPESVINEELEDIFVGSPGDIGIDGMAIIANDTLITDRETLGEVMKAKEVKINFVFVQAKNKSQFNRQEFLDFTGGVREVFRKLSPEKPPTRRASTLIQEKIQLVTELMQRYSEEKSFESAKPTCKLYYLLNADTLSLSEFTENLVEKEQEKLHTTYFENVEIKVEGINYIQQLYKNTWSKPIAQVKFDKQTTLPEIRGITQAFIGVLPCSEFMKIITHEDGKIRSSVFEENVRAYDKRFSVNQDMTKTMQSPEKDWFAILNNGVTIVARESKQVGNQITLIDYQIVNGCQTSHVIYENRNNPGIENVLVTVKIISTDDQNIINKITYATNNQTPVKEKNLQDLLKFHKKLEELYDACKIFGKNGEKVNRLYYERREAQYVARTDVIQARVVSTTRQAKCFAGMFLDIPHLSAGHYNKIKDKVGQEIFVDNHNLLPYYTSALGYYEVLKIMNNASHKEKLGSYKKFKFHILMIIKYLVAGLNQPKPNNKQMETYCHPIVEVLDSVLEPKNRSIYLKRSVYSAVNMIIKTAMVYVKITKNKEYRQPTNYPGLNEDEGFTNYLKEYLQAIAKSDAI